jgi:TraE protein
MVLPKIKPYADRLKAKVNLLEKQMVGAIEKGVEVAELSKPPEGVYEGVDLRILPKYISFRAALLHNKLTQQYIILILSAVCLATFVISRVEIYSLYGKLREKEYILAPGVMDFTAASPSSVSENYVEGAVTQFLGLLGNVTPGSIEAQYATLSDFMSQELKAKFWGEAQPWKEKVQREGISELLTITQKEIRSSETGYYKVTALARRDTYINSEYIGYTDEVIEMVLQLVPPKIGKAWFLQINSLSRQKAETFRSKQNY